MKNYPIRIELKGDIGGGMVRSTRNECEVRDSRGAVTLKIEVNSNDYPREKVEEAIKEICQTVVECYR